MDETTDPTSPKFRKPPIRKRRTNRPYLKHGRKRTGWAWREPSGD